MACVKSTFTTERDKRQISWQRDRRLIHFIAWNIELHKGLRCAPRCTYSGIIITIVRFTWQANNTWLVNSTCSQWLSSIATSFAAFHSYREPKHTWYNANTRGHWPVLISCRTELLTYQFLSYAFEILNSIHLFLELRVGSKWSRATTEWAVPQHPRSTKLQDILHPHVWTKPTRREGWHCSNIFTVTALVVFVSPTHYHSQTPRNDQTSKTTILNSSAQHQEKNGAICKAFPVSFHQLRTENDEKSSKHRLAGNVNKKD